MLALKTFECIPCVAVQCSAGWQEIVGHSDLIPRGNTILSPSAPVITYLVGGEEAEVEGRVGDDVSLGALGGAGHDLVSHPGWLQLQISQLLSISLSLYL